MAGLVEQSGDNTSRRGDDNVFGKKGSGDEGRDGAVATEELATAEGRGAVRGELRSELEDAQRIGAGVLVGEDEGQYGGFGPWKEEVLDAGGGEVAWEEDVGNEGVGRGWGGTHEEADAAAEVQGGDEVMRNVDDGDGNDRVNGSRVSGEHFGEVGGWSRDFVLRLEQTSDEGHGRRRGEGRLLQHCNVGHRVRDLRDEGRR